MTEEELRVLLESWDYKTDATSYAARLQADGIWNLGQIAHVKVADLAATLAGGEEHIVRQHKVHASDMIAKAAGRSAHEAPPGSSAHEAPPGPSASAAQQPTNVPLPPTRQPEITPGEESAKEAAVQRVRAVLESLIDPEHARSCNDAVLLGLDANGYNKVKGFRVASAATLRGLQVPGVVIDALDVWREEEKKKDEKQKKGDEEVTYSLADCAPAPEDFWQRSAWTGTRLWKALSSSAASMSSGSPTTSASPPSQGSSALSSGDAGGKTTSDATNNPAQASSVFGNRAACMIFSVGIPVILLIALYTASFSMISKYTVKGLTVCDWLQRLHQDPAAVWFFAIIVPMYAVLGYPAVRVRQLLRKSSVRGFIAYVFAAAATGAAAAAAAAAARMAVVTWAQGRWWLWEPLHSTLFAPAGVLHSSVPPRWRGGSALVYTYLVKLGMYLPGLHRVTVTAPHALAADSSVRGLAALLLAERVLLL